MFFYYSRVYRATVTGARVREEKCEKCGTDFYYELNRTGQGRASAPYAVGLQAAAKRAENSAKKQLAKRLERDAELVPCPKCRWVNEKTVRTYRKSRHTGFVTAMVLVLFVTAIVDFFLWVNGQNFVGRVVTATDILLVKVSAVGLAASCGLMAMQWYLRSRIDPNGKMHGHPVVPPGTPPALMKVRDSQGRVSVEAVPSVSNVEGVPTWAVFRAGKLVFEPLCCQCLTPTQRWYRKPLGSNNGQLLVPICVGCQRRINMKAWLLVLVMIPVAAMVGWITSALFSDPLKESRIMWMVVGGIFTFAAGFGWSVGRLHPYRIKTVDRSRAVWRIWFANPAYTAILIKRIGQAETVDGRRAMFTV